MTRTPTTETDDPLYVRLAAAAAARQFVFYDELAAEMGLDVATPGARAAVWERLAAVNRSEVSAGRPMLSSVCVQAQDHLPGPGFFAQGIELGLVGPYEDEVKFAARQVKATHDAWSDLEPFGAVEETG